MEKFISVNELSIQVGIAAPTVRAMIERGQLKPDGETSSGEILFKESRLQELRQTVAGNYGIGRAIAARREQFNNTGK